MFLALHVSGTRRRYFPCVSVSFCESFRGTVVCIPPVYETLLEYDSWRYDSWRVPDPTRSLLVVAWGTNGTENPTCARA